MNVTKIEWTDRTWNPVTGCTKVSPGCDNCYAEGIARRFAGSKAFPHGFDVTLHSERLGAPQRWRKPARVFVNSMSDLFHDDIPDRFIADVFAVMALTQQHTYQVLTKRHGRMRSLLSSAAFFDQVAAAVRVRGEVYSRELVGWPLPNVWMGVSAEAHDQASLRIPALLQTPAAARFVSAEPLLGPVDLSALNARNGAVIDCLQGDVKSRTGEIYAACPARLDWVIVGGESGPGARPLQEGWVRGLRDQCTAAGVSFFFKQWGESAPLGQLPENAAASWEIRNGMGYPEATMCRVGKKAAGRELDGRTWDEYPAVAS